MKEISRASSSAVGGIPNAINPEPSTSNPSATNNVLITMRSATNLELMT